MTPPTLAPTGHHPRSPSKFPVWAICACFDSEEDPSDAIVITDENTTAGDAKARGIAQHEARAKALTGQPDAYAGLTEREEAQVRWVVETEIEEARSLGYTPEEFHVEQRLTMMEGDSFKVLYFGTADNEYGPVVTDAKFGDPRNYFAQLCGYALAKMERDNLTGIIARVYYGRWRKTVPYLITRETAETVVYGILAKRDNPNRQPVACEYCDWCQHKAYCEALTGKVNVLLDKRGDWGVSLPTMRISEAGADPALLGAMRYIWKMFIEPWGSGVEYATKVLAENGNTPLGFKRQDEKGDLEMQAGDVVIRALIDGGMARENIEAAAKFSMTALKKQYVAQFGGSEATAAKKVEEILVKASAAKRGDATFKLIRNKDAEMEIRAALARPAQEAIT